MASWIDKAKRLGIYNRDNLICCYCGVQCIIGDTRDNNANKSIIATLDHIVPQKELAASATNDKHFNQLRRESKNLVCVCMSCNSSKQHTELFVWCKQTDRDYAAIIAEIARRIVKPVVKPVIKRNRTK